MGNLTLDELNLDLSTLQSKKLFIKVLQENLDNVENFDKIMYIEASIQKNESPYNKETFSITQGFIKDFPHEKIKQIIKDFLLKRKNSLLSEYEIAIRNFKKKYENTGLDFSRELRELENILIRKTTYESDRLD